VRQGRRIDRSLWPDRGPYRQFLAFLDRVHEENGIKSLRSIADGMSVNSPTRIGGMLRGVNGTLPADVIQLEELIRALGGGSDEISRGRVLYQKAVQARSEADRIKPSPSTLTSLGVAPAPRQLPNRIAGFVGRNAELGVLNELAGQAGSSAATVVISAVDGTAGIGKTALALYWAHEAADNFPDGQLYLDLRGFDAGGLTLTSADAVRGLLDAFEITTDRIPVGEEAQASLLRSILAGASDADCSGQRARLPASPTTPARKPRMHGGGHQPQSAGNPNSGRRSVPAHIGPAERGRVQAVDRAQGREEQSSSGTGGDSRDHQPLCEVAAGAQHRCYSRCNAPWLPPCVGSCRAPLRLALREFHMIIVAWLLANWPVLI
jgi:hypothetical protein